MNYENAKQTLLMHGPGYFDVSRNAEIIENEGFLNVLRPYQGLKEQNFHSIIHALFVVGEHWHKSEKVDRDLVHSVWYTCRIARLWGLDPKAMLQTNNLITPQDTARLQRWVQDIEFTALDLLQGGCPPYMRVDRYAEYIVDVGPGDNVEFFVPLFQQFIEDPKNEDPTTVIEALGKLGKKSCAALTALRAASTRKFGSWCNDEVHEAIKNAIKLIENAP